MYLALKRAITLFLLCFSHGVHFYMPYVQKFQVSIFCCIVLFCCFLLQFDLFILSSLLVSSSGSPVFVAGVEAPLPIVNTQVVPGIAGEGSQTPATTRRVAYIYAG